MCSNDRRFVIRAKTHVEDLQNKFFVLNKIYLSIAKFAAAMVERVSDVHSGYIKQNY